MPYKNDPPRIAARRVLREADYAARGRQLTKRKAEDYQRRRDLQAAQGETEIWVWVPGCHVQLIRAVAAAFCAALKENGPSLPPLSWEQSKAGALCSTSVRAPGLRLDTGDGVATAAEVPWDETDDPALWRGMGLPARRNAQARRARARKLAAGRKRLHLVLPGAFKSEVTAFLEKILARLEEGLVPVLDVVPDGTTAPELSSAADRPDAPALARRSTKIVGRPSATAAPVTPRQLHVKNLQMPDSSGTSQPATVPPDPPPLSFNVKGVPKKSMHSLPDVRMSDDVMSVEKEQFSPLFEDIQALSRLPGFLRGAQPTGKDGG